MNQPIAHERVKTEFADVFIRDFDESLEAAFNKVSLERAKANWKAEQQKFFGEYGAYLHGEKWAEKRRKVLARCNGRCEGCGNAKATVVHHLTYEHVYDEFLFELVGLCQKCHDRIHVDRDERPGT